jgi:hypothetical protein
MRASREEQVGGAGVSEVSAAFERLGWGVVENTRHDLGTDLFLMARDERLFDLGLLVGAQVKAGESYFREPVRDSAGQLQGWWYRDDDRAHIDAWIAHAIPHLIVLHDLDARISYWAHVIPESVVSTGKGAKVLVPNASTVDEQHRDELLAIAAASRPGVQWEGSAWTGVTTLAARDRLRHALVVPRILAPHPNAGHDVAIDAVQAIALLVQARLHDLEAFAEKHTSVPSLAEALDADDWMWRFVGALGERLTTGKVDGIEPLLADPPDSAARAAATIVAAAGLLEDARADEAAALLELTLGRDDAEPVDHAWLQIQRARTYAEIGRVDEARTEALEAQKIRIVHGSDVTATAIGGVAAELLFATSAWGQEDVADVIVGMDTAAARWRTQTMSWGLVALVQRSFKAWSRDSATTFGIRDEVNDQLLSASLTDNYLGNQSSWRHSSGLLGQANLLRLGRDADPDVVRSALETLRHAGDRKSLELAVRWIDADGPATAIALAASDVRLESSTRTTGPTNLALLQYGGDLVDEATADRSVAWLLETLRDSGAFFTRTNPSYLLDLRLVDTLSALVRAASPRSRELLVQHIAGLLAQADQAYATSWSRVVTVIPGELWSPEAANDIARNVEAHHNALRIPLLGIVARYDDVTRDRLIAEAGNGSLDALAAFGDVRELPHEVVAGIVEQLAARVEQQVQDAAAGSFGFGGPDFARALALLNIWHPSAANWDPLLVLLADNAVAGSHKEGAFRLLAVLSDRIPHAVHERLRELAVDVSGRPQPSVPFPFFGDAAGAAAGLAAVLGALPPQTADERLLDLLAGDSNRRQNAAIMADRLRRPTDVGILVALVRDSEPQVRAAAAAGLASLAAAGQNESVVKGALERALSDPGTKVPTSVVNTLAYGQVDSPVAQEILGRLRTHASAYVRMVAGRALN